MKGNGLDLLDLVSETHNQFRLARKNFCLKSKKNRCDSSDDERRLFRQLLDEPQKGKRDTHTDLVGNSNKQKSQA